MSAKSGAQTRSYAKFCTGLVSVTASVLLSGHVVSAQVAPTDEAAPTLRLPADVEPKAYALDLDVVPTADSFGGKVTIRLALKKARRTIWLHGQGVKVSAVKARSGGKEVVGTFTQASSDGLARVVLSEPVGPGDIVLTLDFSSAFNTRNDGFYKFVYAGESYAMTKFEALSARLAFPCFDEPAFKAPLTLTVQAPANLVVVANSAIEREDLLPGGKKAWHFKATPPLPTYLYAWAVGPWDEVLAPPVPASDWRPRPLPLRGLAARGKGPALAQSLALAPALVRHLEEYFRLPFPFEKLDLLAAPDFMSGAMENAGLITFSDALLLVDEHNAPLRLRQVWVMVMAHELAHQWFGDLVTLAWWDDIWLNEAFAEWLSYPISALARPRYQYSLLLANRVDGAMTADSLLSARRVRQTIRDSGDVQNAFDSLTYEKGAALIGMFARYLGPENFRRGIHDYLVTHAGGTTTVDDLLASLSRSSGKDAATPFKTFLDQPGVPLLRAKLDCSNSGKASLALEQSRFLPAGSTGDPHALWQLPVCARYGTGSHLTTACTLLTTAAGSLDLPGEGCPEIVFPNAGGEGYFVWSLPGPELLKLSVTPGLSDEERLSLSNTLYAGYRAGAVPAADALSALAGLVGDPEPNVSAPFSRLLAAAKDHLVAPPDRPAVMKKAAEIYRPILAQANLSSKGHDEDVRMTERRSRAASAMLNIAEDPATRRELAALGRAYLGPGTGAHPGTHPEALDPTLESMALQALLQVDPARFDPWLERLKTEQDPLLREQLLRALCADRNVKHAARMRALTFDTRLRVRERQFPIRIQMGDFRTRPQAWAWLELNIDPLADALGVKDRANLPALGDGFCSGADAEKVEAMFRPRLGKLVGGERILTQTLETIHLCASLVAAQRASAHQFFAGHRATGARSPPGH